MKKTQIMCFFSWQC